MKPQTNKSQGHKVTRSQVEEVSMKPQTHNTQYSILNTIAVVLVCLILPQAQTLAVSLNITADNGSVTATPDKADYDLGEVVELIPKPDTGYYFAGWDGDAQGKRLVLNLTMDTDKEITANFKTWESPIGLPEPEFGIFETYRMYDDPANRNPDLTYHQNAEGGYYTHYVDNTHPDATDSGNPYGTVSMPRNTIPGNLPEGSVVEVHGGPYSYWNLSGDYYTTWISGTGTEEKPVFIRGAAGETPIHTKMRIQAEGCSYVVIENFNLDDSTIGLSYRMVSDHISFRNLEVHGGPPMTTAAVSAGDVGHSHIVVYNNYIHNNGDPEWHDENDFCAVKAGGRGGEHPEHIWVVDNHMHGNGGDSISADGQPGNLVRYYYVGRNIMHEEGENAVDLKESADVVLSENIMYGFGPTNFASSGSDGTAVVINDDRPHENI